MKKAVIALDQGTTGSRAVIYDPNGRLLSWAYQEFSQHYPKPGWVEHSAEEIWHSVCFVIRKSLRKARLSSSEIAAIGITNQRETVVLWNKSTGKPVSPAIVWQDRRTADYCDSLKKRGLEAKIRSKTGLVIDPYFSATKLRWLLKNNPRLLKLSKKGELCFGTIDTWLLWKLTGGQSHFTDATNASRTLIYNIHQKKWDEDLLKLFGIPSELLPQVKKSGDDFGIACSKEAGLQGIPVTAVIGDQQAALYGQACNIRGQAKNTYGTGCFMMMNLGKKAVQPPHGLLLTLAADQKGDPCYAFEGAVFIGGAVIQWLRDGLGFFKRSSETEKMAASVKDSGGVVMIPAFTGLGSPYWDPHVRGMITGLTRGTHRAHLVRAALESIAHQCSDVFEAMKESSIPINQLKVDGGASANRFLMQFQSDLLRIPVIAASRTESTAWGAAKLAGLKADFWKDFKALDRVVFGQKYHPRLSRQNALKLRRHWKEEIKRLKARF